MTQRRSIRAAQLILALTAACSVIAGVFAGPAQAATADSAAAATAAPAGSGAFARVAYDPAKTTAPAPVGKPAQGFTMLPKAPAGRGIPFAGSHTAVSTFTCNYFAYVPVYVIDFTCNVSAGAIALWVDCNGVRYYSQPLPAVGTYYTRANCYPYLITNFDANSLL